jgi:hypothetical protein
MSSLYLYSYTVSIWQRSFEPYLDPMKALVWFWWIDETLSANLIYQSDHEIGSTIPSGGAYEDHDDGVVTMMIKCLDMEKKKERNKKLKAKVKTW